MVIDQQKGVDDKRVALMEDRLCADGSADGAREEGSIKHERID